MQKYLRDERDLKGGNESINMVSINSWSVSSAVALTCECLHDFTELGLCYFSSKGLYSCGLPAHLSVSPS